MQPSPKKHAQGHIGSPQDSCKQTGKTLSFWTQVKVSSLFKNKQTRLVQPWLGHKRETHAELTLITFLLLSATQYHTDQEQSTVAASCPIEEQLVVKKKVQRHRGQQNMEPTLHEFCKSAQRLSTANGGTKSLHYYVTIWIKNAKHIATSVSTSANWHNLKMFLTGGKAWRRQVPTSGR